MRACHSVERTMQRDVGVPQCTGEARLDNEGIAREPCGDDVRAWRKFCVVSHCNNAKFTVCDADEFRRWTRERHLSCHKAREKRIRDIDDFDRSIRGVDVGRIGLC